MATIVTGYFQLEKSKASHDKYTDWMKNMLIIDNPMVIFCDEISKDLIHEFRKTKLDKTIIIVTKITDFYTYKYYDNFVKHYDMDLEQRVGHTPFLYMIWNEKSHFLKRAIELDPFHTDYFIWVDIGCFRIPNTDFLNWPNPSRIEEMKKDKILLLLVQPFTIDECGCSSLSDLPSFQTANRIGGTMFGGGKDILLAWHVKYYSMLEYFISINRFIGKDQSIMNCVFLLNRRMCDLIGWTAGCKNHWFYIQDYLK